MAAVSEEQPGADVNARITEGMVPIMMGDMPPEELGAMDRERWQRNLSTYEAFGMVDRARARSMTLWTIGSCLRPAPRIPEPCGAAVEAHPIHHATQQLQFP